MTILRIDESSLLKMGFDRPTVKALAHLLHMVGNSEITTLPQLIVFVTAIREALDVVTMQPVAEPFTPADDLAPVVVFPSMPDDLTPPAQLLAQVEYLQTEVRQLAEQQAVLMRKINDLQQGLAP